MTPNLGRDFIILLDALRHDFIDQTRTPFLHSLKMKSTRAEVIETYAFQTRPAFFAGLEPDESGICHLYAYDPDNTCFGFLKPFIPLLKSFDPWGYRKAGRGIIRRIARMQEKLRGNPASAAVMSASEVPLHLLPLFRLSEEQFTDKLNLFSPHETIFDHLSKNGKSWRWIGYPRHFGSTKSILSEYRKSKPADVTYLHFSELDWLGHRYGPVSKEIDSALKEFDTILKDLLTPALDNGGRVAIFGDHGMVEVTGSVDLISLLKKLPYKLGEDYITFLDSTQARFWFKSDSARSDVITLLSQIQYGRILQTEERQALGIAKHTERFGELIFAMEGGKIIHPSFFSHAATPPKGMHGYLPEVQDNKTQILLSSPEDRQLGIIKMVEIYRHLIGLLS